MAGLHLLELNELKCRRVSQDLGFRCLGMFSFLSPQSYPDAILGGRSPNSDYKEERYAYCQGG